ncbi:MAG TPA: hypothetical protein ENH22_00775, partial [Candidatus Campbellbacteria bacterium]|nr:hypothetical protein [Candidatus Campbellbacteria bacterium]
MVRLKNKRIIIISISVFIAGAFLFLTMFYLRNKSRNNIGNKKKNTVIELNTSNWPTYKNKKYGYQFKYPNVAKVIDDEKHPYNSGFQKSVLIYLPKKYPELKERHFYDEDVINIKYIGYSNKFGKSADEIIKSFAGGKLTLLKSTRTIQGVPMA